VPREIRCAVLGLGRLGYRHAVNVATKVEGAKLVAVSDAVPQRAEEVARELNVPFWSTNPDEILNRDDIDAVLVVTPTATHAELANKVAKTGKALFLEKPLSLNLDEAAEAMQVVESSGIICQLGFMRRFDPAYKNAYDRIVAGDIGEPLYFKAVTRDPVPPHEAFIAASGGIYADLSIHDYDIARFLMRREVVQVTALGSVVWAKEFEKYGDVDQAITYLNFEGGAAGDCEGYRNAFYGYDIRAEVLGTEGTIVVSGLRQYNVTLLQPKRGSFDILPGFTERFEDAYVREIEDFVDCVRTNRKPSVGVFDGYQALAIASAARKSFVEQRKVSVQSLSAQKTIK
jgi:scyllo-inositol 2-dehydrogenase (NAD+)